MHLIEEILINVKYTLSFIHSVYSNIHRRNMEKLSKTLNDFFDISSINGLAYLSNGQSQCTRKIWFIITVSAFTMASYFLAQTISGFDAHYTSTNIETRECIV